MWLLRKGVLSALVFRFWNVSSLPQSSLHVQSVAPGFFNGLNLRCVVICTMLREKEQRNWFNESVYIVASHCMRGLKQKMKSCREPIVVPDTDDEEEADSSVQAVAGPAALFSKLWVLFVRTWKYYRFEPFLAKPHISGSIFIAKWKLEHESRKNGSVQSCFLWPPVCSRSVPRFGSCCGSVRFMLVLQFGPATVHVGSVRAVRFSSRGNY